MPTIDRTDHLKRREILGTLSIIGLSSVAGCLGRPNLKSSNRDRPESDAATRDARVTTTTQLSAPSTNQNDSLSDPVVLPDEDPRVSMQTPTSPSYPRDEKPLYQDGPYDSPWNIGPESRAGGFRGRNVKDVTLEVFNMEYDPGKADSYYEEGEFEFSEDRFSLTGSAYTEYRCDRFIMAAVEVWGTWPNIGAVVDQKTTPQCEGSSRPGEADWRHDYRVSGEFVGPAMTSISVTLMNRTRRFTSEIDME